MPEITQGAQAEWEAEVCPRPRKLEQHTPRCLSACLPGQRAPLLIVARTDQKFNAQLTHTHRHTHAASHSHPIPSWLCPARPLLID